MLLALLQTSHEQAAYPVRPEAVSRWFLVPPEELSAWVAVNAGVVVGHVALHEPHGDTLPLWEAGTGLPRDRLVALSRLFSAGTTRGVGSALLRHALAAAADLDRHCVIEVNAAAPALGLYLRQGWRELGRMPQVWGTTPVCVAALSQPDTCTSDT